MSDETNPDTLPAAVLPQISNLSLNSSTPYRSTVSSCHSGPGKSTHSSIDQFLQAELHEKVFVDVDHFFTKFVLPTSAVGIELLNELIKNVCNHFRNFKDWEMPNTYLDSVYVPWLVGIMSGVCKHAAQVLREGAKDTTNALNVNSTQLATDWQEMLRVRKWAAKPGVMRGSLAKRTPDILLSANDSTGRWDTTMIIGEHKSRATLGEMKKAITQLAGYAGELFGVQSFRQFVLCFTLLRGKMRLWVCDRMGCYGSREFSISTNSEAERQELVKIILALTIKDYAALGFDPNVYSDPTCQQMFTPNSKMPPGVLGYLKVKDEIICLKKLIFIRPGLITRGTRCFLADSSTQSSLIVKISWRFEDLVPEGENLKAIRENLEVVYVVRLHTYDEACNIEKDIHHGPLEGQPFLLRDPVDVETRLNFGDVPKAKESSMNRILTRTVLLDSGRPLIEARSALEFLRGVYNAFVGHGTLYFHHHVLHRDISQSNILLVPIDNKVQDRYGFLIDLDYAADVVPDTLVCESTGAPHRTGTLPFMAIDILRGEHSSHLYHYDVESFLYVLIWSCIYDGDQKGYNPPTDAPDYNDRIRAARCLTIAIRVTSNAFLDPLVQWRKGLPRQIATYKHLMMMTQFDAILRHLRPGYNHKAIVQLLSKMRSLIFCAPSFTRPIERMEAGWSVESRKLDEIALYDGVKKAMEDAIAQLEIEEEHDQKQR